jgi:lysine-arginine-ornithine-binding protein
MKRLVGISILLSLVINVQAAELTFATEATYPPFESVDSSGKIVGFDVDIMNALCQQMRAKCTLVNAPFDSLIPNLQNGKYDGIIAALAITPQREKVVSFTAPYYIDTVSLVAKKGAHLQFTNAGLMGKTIGIQGDTVFYQYLKAKYGTNIKINTYKSQDSAFLDLMAGRIDAVMGDTPLIAMWLQQDQHYQEYGFVGEPLSDETYFGSGSGIAVKKSNTVLLQKLNVALAAVKNNGQYLAISYKWFGA